MRTMLFAKSFRFDKRTLPKSAKPAKARFPRVARNFCQKTT
jgi:hypothetical protein